MAASILHRAAGVAIYGGLLILAGWVFALEAGPAPFTAYVGALHTPLGLTVLFLITLALFFHLANGVRHLAWDIGAGFLPKTASATAWAAFLLAAAINMVFWFALVAAGKV